MNSSSETSSTSVSLSSEIVFYIFLLLDIPSVICSLLLFYYFIHLNEIRRDIYSNLMLIYLLIGTFLVTSVDIPLILPYLKNLYYILLMKYPKSFCMFWIAYDYGIYSLNLWLMALTCFERYLIIFYKQIIMKNKRRRFLMYYLSMTIIVLFVLFWYLYLIVLYPCEQDQFDYTQMLCSFPCYKIVGSVFIINTDWIIADLLPVFLTIFFILILILHVFYHKYQMSKRLMQINTWKRTRKMFLQLVPIGLIFLLFNMPLIIVGLLAIANPWFNTTPYFYVNSFSYCLAIFMPFAILSKQTILRKRILRLITFKRLNQTEPINTNTLPLRLMNTQITQKKSVVIPTINNT